MTRMFRANRVSRGQMTLFRMCHAMTMAMTMVLPEPVAIFAHSRSNVPPSDGSPRRPSQRLAPQ